MLTAALLGTSCKSTNIISGNDTSTVLSEHIGQNDSTVVEKTVTPVVVPQSNATLSVTPEALNSLPPGGEFRQQSGNATVGARKEENGSITITANCDSLVLLVENLKQEVYHFRRENTALKSEKSEQQTLIVKEPSSWQWFQIWLGRIFTGTLLLWVIYRLIKHYLKF